VIVSVVAELLVPRVFCPKERSWLTTVTSPSTAKEVVDKLAINPNTVPKAYRELEREGLVTARPGLGTFVRRSLGGSRGCGTRAPPGWTREDLEALFGAVVLDSFRMGEDTA
jgi:GntR family transcriptional regulator